MKTALRLSVFVIIPLILLYYVCQITGALIKCTGIDYIDLEGFDYTHETAFENANGEQVYVYSDGTRSVTATITTSDEPDNNLKLRFAPSEFQITIMRMNGEATTVAATSGTKLILSDGREVEISKSDPISSVEIHPPVTGRITSDDDVAAIIHYAASLKGEVLEWFALQLFRMVAMLICWVVLFLLLILKCKLDQWSYTVNTANR